MINVHTDYTLKGIGATGAASNSEEAINIVRSGAENGFRLTYNLNGSFESLMMGFGEKKWESFQMMSALEFLRCYDPKFMMPEEYVQ